MEKKSFLLILSAFIPCFMKADWPQFRGPDGQGHSKEKNVPLEWSDEKNVKPSKNARTDNLKHKTS